MSISAQHFRGLLLFLHSLFHTWSSMFEMKCVVLSSSCLLPYSFSCREVCRGHVAFLSASYSLHSCWTCWADCLASPHGQIGEGTSLSFFYIIMLVQAVVSCMQSEDHYLLRTAFRGLSCVTDIIYMCLPVHFETSSLIVGFHHPVHHHSHYRHH